MNISCPLHNSKIIQIDVDINTPLGERAVCIECPSKSRENVVRIMQQYKSMSKSIIDEIRERKNVQIQFQKELKKRICNIQEQFNVQINQIANKLEKENQKILDQLIEKEIELELDEEYLTLSKLQNIAQMVVKKSYCTDSYLEQSKEYKQIIEQIELINQQLSKEVEQLQLDLHVQLNQLNQYLIFESNAKFKKQVIYQLDQNYDTCALNDKFLFLTNKNENIIYIYKLEELGVFTSLVTQLNDIISLGLNQQQLFARSSENNISIYQIDKSYAQKQTLIRAKIDNGWNTCMVSIENKQFLFCAQPTPKIIIYIKDQESQKWSEHQVLEDFCWPISDLSCHSITMNIVICTYNKDIFIWKQEAQKNNQINWVPLCDPIKKAHNDRIYSVSWVKQDQFISGGLEIKNWKQTKSGSFINIQKLDKLHIIGRLCYLSIPNIVIVQEQDNCLEICQIDDKDQLVKQDSIKGNYKILSVSQESSSIVVNNFQKKTLQVLKFYL